MKFVVLSFYFCWFYLPVGLNFLTKVYFFQPMSKHCFLHIQFVVIFYVAIFLNSNFPYCSFPDVHLFSLFFPSVFTFSLLCPLLLLLFLLSSFFPLFNLLPSILHFSRVSHLHHPPVFHCLPLLPSTLHMVTFSFLFHSMTDVKFRDYLLFQMKNKSDNYWVVGLDEKSQQIR